MRGLRTGAWEEKSGSAGAGALRALSTRAQLPLVWCGDRVSSGPSLERRSHWALRISHTSILASNRNSIGANNTASMVFVSDKPAPGLGLALSSNSAQARARPHRRTERLHDLIPEELRRRKCARTREVWQRELHHTFAAQTLRQLETYGSCGTVQPPRLHRCVAKLRLAKAWSPRGEGQWLFKQSGSCHTVLDRRNINTAIPA